MPAQISLAGAPYPAMIVYQPYEDNGVLTDLDCYLYLDMHGTPGQYIDHLGTIEVKDGKFYVGETAHDDQNESLFALFTVWQKTPRR